KSLGTGLGLSITQKLVKIMGGKIHVESVLGQGSRFWIELDLPEVITEAPSTVSPQEQRIIGYQGQPRKILVVDDISENCLVLINLLKPLGFEIKKANSGQEGVEKALQWQPDLILMDLIMPGGDGFEATRQIKQIPLLKHVVIIAVSASAFKDYKQKSLEAGCDGFIEKPVRTKVLFDCLQKHLNLTYIYEVNENHHEVCQNERPLVGPNSEQATILFNLTLRGDIEGIIEYVKKLKQNNEQLAPFVQKIDKLTNELAIKKIREFVKKYLSTEP
ncbi:MAG: response regulator, partial [Candidatus Parabeggiatoa sp.]|nr:response regulator [Candidatus Parabeggiatoa sp.]